MKNLKAKHQNPEKTNVQSLFSVQKNKKIKKVASLNDVPHIVKSRNRKLLPLEGKVRYCKHDETEETGHRFQLIFATNWLQLGN